MGTWRRPDLALRQRPVVRKALHRRGRHGAPGRVLWILRWRLAVAIIVMAAGLALLLVSDRIPLSAVPLVASVLVAVAIVLMRSYLLHRLTYEGGAVRVVPHDENQSLGEPGVETLTALLSTRLARLHISPPAPLPQSIPATRPINAIAVAGSAGADAFLDLVLGVVSQIRPSHAIEMNVGFSIDRASGRCSATAELSFLATRRHEECVGTGSTWGQAIDSVAARAAVMILPVTRSWGQEPWKGWRNDDLPSELLLSYERANDLVAKGRLDEALGQYYQALRIDPKNLAIRIELGLLKESMGLHIDALADYLDVYGVACGGTRTPIDRFALTPTTTTGLYRMANVLGRAGELTRQWFSSNDPRRAVHQRDLRRDIRRGLVAVFGAGADDGDSRWTIPYFPDPAIRGERGEKYLLGRALGHDGVGRPAGLTSEEDDNARRLLERYFGALSAAALEQLAISLDSASGDAGWYGESHRTMTPAAVRVARVWVRGRLSRTLLSGETLADLPLRPEDVALSLAQAVGNGKSTNSGTLAAGTASHKTTAGERWLVHYNTACTYAVLLQRRSSNYSSGLAPWAPSDGCDESSREGLVAEALNQLERSASSMPPGTLASVRNWILFEDPDLHALRREPGFVDFESRWFPSPVSPRNRGATVARYVAAKYVRRLVYRAAELQSARWSSLDGSELDGAEWETMFKSDTAVWEALSELIESPRDWNTRVRFIELVEAEADPASQGVGTREPFEDTDAEALDPASAEGALDRAIALYLQQDRHDLRSLHAWARMVAEDGHAWERLCGKSRKTDLGARFHQKAVERSDLWRQVREFLRARPGERLERRKLLKAERRSGTGDRPRSKTDSSERRDRRESR